MLLFLNQSCDKRLGEQGPAPTNRDPSLGLGVRGSTHTQGWLLHGEGV